MSARFQYEDNGDTRFGHIYRPIAKVKFKSPKLPIFVDIWMIVDTGADYSILPRHFSEKLRISLERDCIKDTTVGVGGEEIVYFVKDTIEARIGDLKRNVPIAFFDSDEVPALLGRLGFLETFDCEFLKSHTVMFKG